MKLWWIQSLHCTSKCCLTCDFPTSRPLTHFRHTIFFERHRTQHYVSKHWKDTAGETHRQTPRDIATELWCSFSRKLTILKENYIGNVFNKRDCTCSRQTGRVKRHTPDDWRTSRKNWWQRSTFKGVQSPTNNACRLLNAGRDRDVDEAKLPCLLLAVLLVFIVAVHTNVWVLPCRY